MSTGARAPQGDYAETWTFRGLIAGHRVAALAVATACAVLVAMIAVAVLGAKAGAVTDASTCSQWGSANVDRQNTFARLYVSEHGPVSPRWGPSPAGVINAINAGCDQAFGDGVADSATVVQAISRSF